MYICISVWCFYNINGSNCSESNEYEVERKLIKDININISSGMKCIFLTFDLDQMFVQGISKDMSPISIMTFKSSDLSSDNHAAKIKPFLSSEKVFCTYILGNLTSETGKYVLL